MSAANRIVFNIAEVFNKLYRTAVERVGQTLQRGVDDTQLRLPSNVQLTDLLMNSLQNQFRAFGAQRQSALRYHAGVLISFQQEWDFICSPATCFSCMVRQPKHELPCGHRICASCFGHFSVQSDGWCRLPRCLLCGSETRGMMVEKKPETAAVNVLCIDGGGGQPAYARAS